MATTGTKRFKNYIGGEWVDGSGGDTFASVVPATGESLGEFPRSTPEDVDRAFKLYAEAGKRGHPRASRMFGGMTR